MEEESLELSDHQRMTSRISAGVFNRCTGAEGSYSDTQFKLDKIGKTSCTFGLTYPAPRDAFYRTISIAN
jgi:hypothetical protein